MQRDITAALGLCASKPAANLLQRDLLRCTEPGIAILRQSVQAPPEVQRYARQNQVKRRVRHLAR